MKWIGLTGGIASGKSTVSRMLKAQGIPVIDADEIAQVVVAVGTPGLKSVEAEFGKEVLLPDGTLDRRKLGQLVFASQEKLRRLEAILHPLIRAETSRRREELIKKGSAFAIYDIPLLFETQSQGQFDAIIVVSCSREQQRLRLQKRNPNLSEKEIEERIDAQIPLHEKEKEADFVLVNSRDEAYLDHEIKRLLEWLNGFKSN